MIYIKVKTNIKKLYGYKTPKLRNRKKEIELYRGKILKIENISNWIRKISSLHGEDALYHRKNTINVFIHYECEEIQPPINRFDIKNVQNIK
ncbi:MAG: hypothetical protein ACOC4M_08115 [Promethearchaeia archaeon]